MRLVVIDPPEKPEECLFSEWNISDGWICKLDNKKCDLEYGWCKHLYKTSPSNV